VFVDWDAVPDDELEETYYERLEALTELIPLPSSTPLARLLLLAGQLPRRP